MMDPRWQSLLHEVRAAHALPALSSFAALPEDLPFRAVSPYLSPGAAGMCSDPGLAAGRFAGFHDALIAAAPLALWRETYKNSGASAEFLDRFACYEVIGRDAPFACEALRGFVIYFPAGLHYPWHHHPAEELYLILAGEAEFAVEGETPRVLRGNDTMYHASNVPHAMTTHDQPVMAYVLWRGDMTTKPVWTDPDALP